MVCHIGTDDWEMSMQTREAVVLYGRELLHENRSLEHVGRNLLFCQLTGIFFWIFPIK